MVKWIASVEFAHDYADLGAGEGGYNEDHEFFGYRVPDLMMRPRDSMTQLWREGDYG